MKKTLTFVATCALLGTSGAAQAWDSAGGNPTTAMHTTLTNKAIGFSGFASFIGANKTDLVNGANAEFHELKHSSSDQKKLKDSYGIDSEKLRRDHAGTNSGTDDIAGWWKESLDAWKAGNKKLAYFFLGVMLHMIEDMGVPAHAHGLCHQGGATGSLAVRATSCSRDCDSNNCGKRGVIFDNIEFYVTSTRTGNSIDSTEVSDQGVTTDPRGGLSDPSGYYAVSRELTRADYPSYASTDAHPKIKSTMSDAQFAAIVRRLRTTARVASWAIKSAVNAFKAAQ